VVACSSLASSRRLCSLYIYSSSLGACKTVLAPWRAARKSRSSGWSPPPRAPPPSRSLVSALSSPFSRSLALGSCLLHTLRRAPQQQHFDCASLSPQPQHPSAHPPSTFPRELARPEHGGGPCARRARRESQRDAHSCDQHIHAHLPELIRPSRRAARRSPRPPPRTSPRPFSPRDPAPQPCRVRKSSSSAPASRASRPPTRSTRRAPTSSSSRRCATRPHLLCRRTVAL